MTRTRRFSAAALAVAAAMLLSSATAAHAQRRPNPADGPAGSRPDAGNVSGQETGDSGPDSGDPDGTPEPPAPPPTSLSGIPRAPAAEVDLELETALIEAELLNAWIYLTPTDPGLALIRVAGDDIARTEFLDQVGELVSARRAIEILIESRRLTNRRLALTEHDIAAVDAELVRVNDEVDTTRATLTDLGDDLNEVIEALRSAAVALYMHGTGTTPSPFGNAAAYNDQAELEIRVDATFDELGRQRTELEDAIAYQDAVLAGLIVERAELEAEYAELVDERDALKESLAALHRQINEQSERRDQLAQAMPDAIAAAQAARMVANPVAVPFSLVTFDSYVKAVDAVPEIYPTCGVRWELIAGIAKIESGHATFGGATVDSDGDVSQRILGPLLDGSLEGTQVITDSDGGRLDGNPDFDAAVGPFQFIPSTWSRHALDATGDGFADPHNVYDAALTAAGYLCASSDVITDADVERSVLSYNRSRFYLANVTQQARAYATTLSVPDPPFDVAFGLPEGWVPLAADDPTRRPATGREPAVTPFVVPVAPADLPFADGG